MCEDSLWSDYDGYYEEEEDSPATCSRCGAKNLEWGKIETNHGIKWRLFKGSKLHVCRMNDDEFEDLT